MYRSISIRPSKELRNHYSRISALSRSAPVAITVNGKEDTVVLAHEDFVDQQQYIGELEARLAVYAHLAQAMDDVRLGRTQDMDAAFDDVLADLDEVPV